MSVTLPTPARERSPISRSTRWHGWSVAFLAVLFGAVALVVFGRSSDGGDGLGRMGFVVLLATTIGVVWLLESRARRPMVPSAEIYIPTGFVVALFAVF